MLHGTGLFLTRWTRLARSVIAAVLTLALRAIFAAVLPVLIATRLLAAVFVAARLRLLTRVFGKVHKPRALVISQRKGTDRTILCLGLIARAIAAAVITMAVATIAIAGLLVLLARLLFRSHFTLRFGEHTRVMLCVLQEILGSDAIIGNLGVAREHLVFLDDLLRSATHLAFGAGAVEDTIDDIAEGARAVLLGTRARLGRAHLVL